MKQKTTTSPPPTSTITPKTLLKHQQHSDNKSLQTTTLRLRGSSKAKESPKTPPSSISSTRASSVPPDMKNNSKVKRGIVNMMNKVVKSNEEVIENSQKGSSSSNSREGEEAKVVVLVTPTPPRRHRNDSDGKEKKELLEKLELSENLIKNLQSEVKSLKDELNQVKCLNIELESQNLKLNQNLASAEAKIATFVANNTKKEPIGEHKSPKFKDIQKLIADKLERSKVKKEEVIFVKPSIPSPKPSQAIPEITTLGRKSPTTNQCLLPPPPPLPPPIPSRPLAKLANTQKTPEVVLKKDSKGSVNHHQHHHHKPIANSAHNSIVGEIQNRSAHLLAIREDIQTKGEFINDLINKVVDAAYVDIEDVLNFVHWLDGELSTLADERAVLKHFKWPEKKADAMREAAVEYRELKMLEQEISSYKDDPDIPCVASLKKMASLLDKSERSIQKLIILRNSVMRSYQMYNIPTAWMLDSGITSKIKRASMTLVKMYMKRLTMELESIRNSDRESSQDSLLLQGVHFAYRAHQFAGGLDSETLCAFEEIRQRVPRNLAGSRELLAGIPTS